MSVPTLHNFGRNVTFTPMATYSPTTESDVLEILERHAGKRIRAVGSLHAWSPAATTASVSINLGKLNGVRTLWDDDRGEHRVRVGAGCTVRRLIRKMREQAGLTLPSLGLIQAQTIGGATATGTHGSGKNSMSHYIVAARVAHHDRNGNAVVTVIDGGVELEAVRCAVGMLGIVTELTLQACPVYGVEETFSLHGTLEEVLANEAEFPLQQSYLLPWAWTWVAQRRRESTQERSSTAPLYRLYWTVVMDGGLHAVILSLVRLLRWSGGVRTFFRFLSRLFVIRNWTVVDRSDRQLTMNHDWFRHVEVELFVEADKLDAACTLLEGLLRHLGGEAIPADARRILEEVGEWGRASALHGRYTHHYPICIRKVIADEALLSMAEGIGEPRYAISMISYAKGPDRDVFYEVASLLTDVLGQAFNARPHWGKLCTLDRAAVRSLYPRLPEFLDVARAMDPEGRFGNAWTDGLFAREA